MTGAVSNKQRRLTPNQLEYPEWVREHLTPKLEATELRNPGEVELWFDPRQQASPYPTGHEVYAAVKDQDLLERSLSFGDLQWYEEHPNQIPPQFKGNLIYGWASVVRHSVGFLLVPCLNCIGARPCVLWYFLVLRWRDNVPASLRK